jgi:hypothetical protein
MAGFKLTVAVCALTLSGVLASVAHADPLIADMNKPLAADRNQWAPLPAHKSFEWDSAKSRWGLKLDLDQPGYREMDLNNVQAGVTYKLTQSLRVGGVVSLGDPAASVPRDVAPVPPAPRVKLTTEFKF